MRKYCKRRRICAKSLTCSESGFTLLEVLVALSILAISVVIVFQIFSGNLRALVASDEYVMAAAAAEAHMREALDDKDFAIKSYSKTTDDGYRIDVAIAETEEERTRELTVQLLEVTLTLHWTKQGHDKTMVLKTVKMVEKKV